MHLLGAIERGVGKLQRQARAVAHGVAPPLVKAQLDIAQEEVLFLSQLILVVAVHGAVGEAAPIREDGVIFRVGLIARELGVTCDGVLLKLEIKGAELIGQVAIAQATAPHGLSRSGAIDWFLDVELAVVLMALGA